MTDYDFTGTHVLCDVTGVAPERIFDNALILDAIRRGIEISGAELCGVQTKTFEPAGVTAVYVLSESHVSVPQRIVEVLLDALGPCEYRTSVMSRGQPVRSLVPAGGLE